MKLRLIAATIIVGIVTVTLAACGSDDDDSAADDAVATPQDTGASGAPADVELNRADVEFSQGMIAHHEQAIEMAEIALDPNVGASAEVVDLATRVQAAQDPEIELMRGWLTAAGEPVSMDSADGHDMSTMEGMMPAGQMDALAAASGAEFDQMWLQMMIAHHEGAVSQSETVKAEGFNPDVLALADRIITSQQAEIAEMQALVSA
jgi:uncharacterized protein (DUF305 family)